MGLDILLLIGGVCIGLLLALLYFVWKFHDFMG